MRKCSIDAVNEAAGVGFKHDVDIGAFKLTPLGKIVWNTLKLIHVFNSSNSLKNIFYQNIWCHIYPQFV